MAVAVAIGLPAAAAGQTATSVTISASPSPATTGQSVTFTATTTAPGIVSFSYNGQVVGTAPTAGAAATASGFTSWSYTGNSVALRLAVGPSNNLYVATWNGDDCGGFRCVTKQLTSGGGVNYAPQESWNGTGRLISGLAVSSSGLIYEAVWNGPAQNTIRVRSSIGATSTEFVSSTSICGTCSAGSNYISGMTIDANNNLYVTNTRSGSILKITPAGAVTTYASGLGALITGPVFNNTTGVLYYIDSAGDIRQIPAGGGTPTLLTAASCLIDTNSASIYYGMGEQLALDSAGFIYGAQCGGVTPTSTPHNSPITQVNPTSGAMREYMSWSTCANGSLPNWAAGCGGNYALAFIGDKMYTAGASMGQSNVMGMSTSGYVATLTYTPTIPGSFATVASLAPTDSATYAGSTGNGTLVVGPAAPSAPDLAAASDLGTSSTDDITSDNTPLIEVPGTYATGDTITVTATKSGSANVTCTYVIPATGCSLGTLADGTWSITATDTHPTGGTSTASSALSITVDATAPSAPTGVDLATGSDSGSSSTDNATSDTTPTMSASGGSTGDTMTLTATNGTTTISCSYVLPASSCTMPTMTDGTWSVTATLTDPAGNTSTASGALSMTIDSTGPTGLAPDLLAGSDLGSSSTDNVTSDGTPTITVPGQATGDVITVTASKAGSPDVACTYTVGASTNCTLGTLADGTWNITASVTDPAGNTGTTQSLPITIDTSAPSAPSGLDLAASSDTGASSTDNATSDTTPTMSAAGGQSGDTVTITATKAGSPSVSCTYTVGSATSCDLPALADGTWSVSATLTDPAGNTSGPSTPLSLDIDATGPSGPGVPSMAPTSDTGTSNSDGVTNDTTPEVVVPGATAGDTITVSATNGATTVSCTFVAGPGVNSCPLPALGPGDWDITATSDAVDAAGNATIPSAPARITVDTSNPAPGLPDLASGSDTGPSASDDVTKDPTPTIEVPGVKPGSTVTVVARQPGRPDVVCTFIASATVTGCDLGALGDGSWDITATSVDPAGNQSPASAPLRIFLDTAPPPAPNRPIIDGSAAGGGASPGASAGGLSVVPDLPKGARPSITVTGGTDGDTITATKGGKVITCAFVVGRATSCRLPVLSPGLWTIRATSADPAGNASQSSPSRKVRIGGNPRLSITATSSKPVMRPRERSTVTYRIRNRGTGTARNVRLVVSIPSGLALTSPRATAVTAGRMLVTIGNMAPGDTATRRVSVVAMSTAVGAVLPVKARLSGSSLTGRNAPVLVHRVVDATDKTAGAGVAVTG